MQRFFKPIENQTIVITGASSGIGLAAATMAAQKGANVVISSRNEEDLKTIAENLKAAQGKVHFVKADVTKLEDLENLRNEAIEKFGAIDTWVNNAGTSIFGSLLEVDEEEERQLFETNFWGVRHGCHVAVEAMKDRGGVIINIGSEVSSRSVPVQGLYSATKHAVKAYTDALRMELEHDHIPVSVCLIRPTSIDTPFTEHAANRLRDGEPSLPSPAYPPEEVAKAILSCAERPRRDVFVGAPSLVAFILEYLAPRFADKFYGMRAFREQSRGTDVPHTEENEGLRHAPRREGKLRGGHRGKIKTRAHKTAKHI